MEDDKLKDLFAAFDPELSSDSVFMSQLRHNMQAVELVKQHNRESKRRNRYAVIIASAAGLIMGIMLTLCFPIVGRLLSANADILLWGITAAASAITAINAYNIALTLHSSPTQ